MSVSVISARFLEGAARARVLAARRETAAATDFIFGKGQRGGMLDAEKQDAQKVGAFYSKSESKSKSQ